MLAPLVLKLLFTYYRSVYALPVKIPGCCVQKPNKMAKTRFLDELVNFLGDPIFQIPVRTFMDENCLSKYLST